MENLRENAKNQGCVDMVHERTAQIDLDAIAHNIRVFKQLIGSAALMTVVKANAYGHGMIEVAKTALDSGTDYLGVATVEEALELRKGLRNVNKGVPILAWLHTPLTDFSLAIQDNIELGVTDLELDRVAEDAKRVGIVAKIHLKIDTGLGRNGTTIEKWPEVVKKAVDYSQQKLVDVVGVFSHLALADEPENIENKNQIEVFKKALITAQKLGLGHVKRHIANTPATLAIPEARLDMVRVGLGTYGLSPFANKSPQELSLVPAMTLKTKIANVKKVPQGQGVSYGLKYRTRHETCLALIPLGYADGIPRSAKNACVCIADKKYPIVGTVAMDQCVVDIGLDSTIRAGDGVVIFGKGSFSSAKDLADASGTINYEIVTRIGQRVRRSYIRQDSSDG